MSLINIQNLTFSYDGGITPVFSDVSFQIDTDWRLGFVGRNGRGKTTFLKLLSGELEYRGKISAPVKFDYFPFPVKDKEKPCIEILREICPMSEEWEIMRELSLMKTDCDILYRPFASLSGGEQTKTLLCGLFLNNNNFLLIDEPTNHLDITARQAVAEYLGKKKGFILVSHDRAFLDGCVDHILSINRTNIEIVSGNFSSWLADFEHRQSFEAAQNERLKKDIERLSQSAKRAAAWAEKTEKTKTGGKLDSGLKPDKGYVGHKSARLMKRAKSIDANKQKAIDAKSELLKNEESAYSLKMFPAKHHAERLVTFSNVTVYYGSRPVSSPVDFTLLRGERIALDGKNGCGKSSILNLIVGHDIKHVGNITLAPHLKISYVPQSTAGLSGVLSDFARSNNIDESLFKTILRKMDFDPDMFRADISSYSEGQKKKVLLAKSLCESAHIYIWDEPLNFIDIYTRLQLENLIKECNPTMIFVEHDKIFRQMIATRTVSI